MKQRLLNWLGRTGGPRLTSRPLSDIRPRQAAKPPPCQCGCPNGVDVRGWIGIVAQRKKLGLSEEEALTRAWNLLVETNPFPATLGRICPHPCESDCSRTEKDGAVAVNAMERFVGDWAIQKKLALNRLEGEARTDSIAVIGAGPSGLSFAYQMARRGYPVTVFESQSKPGGMLRFGIPEHRLPKAVLNAEIERVLRLGVELEVNCRVGLDVPLEKLQQDYAAVYLGIGAQAAKRLEVPGENGSGVWGGTDYLNLANQGKSPDLGCSVVVIGGGDTAIDAARLARRQGCKVTIVYRRTRAEMPAADSEVEDALQEGIQILYLGAPVEISRENGRVAGLVIRRIELGEPDASGRRRPLQVEGSDQHLSADSVIVAVAQEPDWGALELLKSSCSSPPDERGAIADSVWAGGDVFRSGIATRAVFHGRRAAEAIHARLRGLPPETENQPQLLKETSVKPYLYEARNRSEPARRPVDEWLTSPSQEISEGLSGEAFWNEAARCFSCGLCFGCENCWNYCNPAGFSRLEKTRPGVYFSVDLARCEGCGKCIEVCPCGYLNTSQDEQEKPLPGEA